LPYFSYKGGVLHDFHVALAAIKFYHKIWLVVRLQNEKFKESLAVFASISRKIDYFGPSNEIIDDY
jgi:hypothetical protein